MSKELSNKKVLDGEFILPSDSVQVIFRANPFQSIGVKFNAPAGLTVQDIVSLAGTRAKLHRLSNLHVLLNGDHLPADWWARIRLKPGTLITIVAVPAGNFAKTILGVVASIAAVVFANVFAGPLLTSILGFTAGSAAATAVTGLIASGLSISASLSIGSIFSSDGIDYRKSLE